VYKRHVIGAYPISDPYVRAGVFVASEAQLFVVVRRMLDDPVVKGVRVYGYGSTVTVRRREGRQ
jgi:hypothetical protein